MPLVTGPSSAIQPVQLPDMVGDYAKLAMLKNQLQEAPLRQQALQQQVQAGQQSLQSGQLSLQKEQQDQQDQQSFRAAMQDPSLHGKTIGDIADVLAQKGAISQGSWVAAKKADTEQRKALSELDEKTLANRKAAHDATQELFGNVMNMPDDQLAANWPQIAQQYDSIPGNQKIPLNPQQPMSKQQLSQFGPMLSMGNSYFDQELARRKAQTDQKTAEATLAEKQATAQFYQQNGGAPGVPTEATQQADWLKKNPGKGPSDYKLWTMRNSPTAVVMNNQLGGAQNSDALDFAADNYRKTGSLPAGFARSPQTTAAIIQRAAALDQQAGGGGVAENKALLHANTNSLTSLQKNYDQVSAFEQTAIKNMDLLQSTAKNIPDLNSRFANVPVRMLNSKMLGTEQMAAFNTALNTAQTEAAKVLNSSSASGVLSDSARHELQQIIDGNMPYKSIVASLNTLKQDMHNRNDSYQQQISDIQGRIKNAGGGNTPAPAAAPAGGNSDPFSQFGGFKH
jgi:hypothetical protein